MQCDQAQEINGTNFPLQILNGRTTTDLAPRDNVCLTVGTSQNNSCVHWHRIHLVFSTYNFRVYVMFNDIGCTAFLLFCSSSLFYSILRQSHSCSCAMLRLLLSFITESMQVHLLLAAAVVTPTQPSSLLYARIVKEHFNIVNCTVYTVQCTVYTVQFSFDSFIRMAIRSVHFVLFVEFIKMANVCKRSICSRIALHNIIRWDVRVSVPC